MSLSPDLALAEIALDRLERLEVRVLVWGLVDSALSFGEVDDTLREVLNDNQKLTADPSCTIDTETNLLQRMMDLGYLVEIPGRPRAPRRFRTRMAEGVRLFARLRQLFPSRHEGTGWVSGATLVADYRLLWRQRRYPARDLTPIDSQALIASRVPDPRVMTAVRVWFEAGGSNWKFARFQIDAAARILEGLTNRTQRGTLVSAGTGSGKTLAFYLPALTWLAAERKAQPTSSGVRILALYPRNELLKDQLAEVYEQARKFDQELGRVGTTLSIGVLYGDTPYTLKSTFNNWRKTQGDCPFFRCPRCNGNLKVSGGTVSEREGRLVCQHCGSAVEARHLRFTRASMTEAPPDILFTSVEMMNQRLADSEIRHLFGLGPKASRSPALMLLDEVHLYTGTFGAQAAHLLRRWSHLSRRQTQFVGLSATIADGAAFFASLVGLDRSVVEEISPNSDHMTSEGAEYMLALRGDPVSQAALLSTSIQALLLASRLMDRRERFTNGSQPFAGWRSFAFTDQLDATNRLFYDMRDAEGRNEYGHPANRRHPNGGLANLRRESTDLRRYEGGQDWRALEANGHDLSTRHRVERTTALDTGVSHDAEIVVATAALEVGYDDPAVGVVLQHKAPRDMAQFLQRKGRAGRTRHMRPWTIMVLSDYGRDRLAYQAYEQFFDPELPPRELPLSNRYIRRMQATYAVIDYLGVAMQRGEPKGSVWRDLSIPDDQSFECWQGAAVTRIKRTDATFPLSPQQWDALKRDAVQGAPQENKYAGRNWLQNKLRRRFLVAQLAAILKDPSRTEDLARYLSNALSLSQEEIDTLLWEHPRPLLLTVIPTALRRLATNWRAHGQTGTDRNNMAPLPEFIPSTLFSDLVLPEVKLLGSRHENVALPVLQSLNEMAPGKVSRRLDDALWIGLTQEQLAADVAAGTSDREVDIAPWYELDPQFPFHLVEQGQIITCAAWLPCAIRLGGLPRSPELRDSSNARLIWRTQLFGRRVGNPIEAPGDRVGIARLVARVDVYTHASQSPATVRRYAIGSNVSLRIASGRTTVDHTALWRFTKAGQPCGVGFEVEADALCFHMNLPASPSVALLNEDPSILRAARTARYQWEAQYGPTLDAVAGNVFLRGWLAQIFKVAAITLAQEQHGPLADAIDQLRAPTEASRLQAVLITIFQSPDAPQDDDNQAPGTEPRLHAKLRGALADAATRDALVTLAQKFLVAPIDVSWDDWLRRAQMQTFAAALIDAIQQACPQIDPEDLVVDTDPGPTESGQIRPDAQLWITEANPGGNGLIEQVVEAISTHPDHFYRRIEAALRPSEFEQIDLQMRDYVQRIGGSVPELPWEDVTQAVRSASSTQAARQSLLQLRQFLSEQGHAVFHGYISALSNRLLRPESPRALDHLLAELLDRWEELESYLGVEVDARVMCAVFSRDARLDSAFTAAGFDLPQHQIETWRFSMLLGVLWARGHALRSHALQVSERFADTPMSTDRLFLAPWISKETDSIDASSPQILELLHDQLRRQGQAIVSMPPDPALIHRVTSLAATVPVQLEYLNVYARLISVVRAQGVVALHYELEATA
ncbi:DEAD/DEAH box helicase [Candidatus Kaiserbacteria bacterium]|nr:DEAD/DEAH box helicase [Candidatus Kaiserbacteria bacterium]